MWEKIDRLLNILMGASIGVFLGHGGFVLWDVKTHPGLYAMASAPWYASILAYLVITLVVLAAAVLIKLLIRSRRK